MNLIGKQGTFMGPFTADGIIVRDASGERVFSVYGPNSTPDEDYQLANLVATLLNNYLNQSDAAQGEPNCVLGRDGDRWYEITPNNYVVGRNRSHAIERFHSNPSIGRPYPFIEENYLP